mgnify:CR=1 FL=1
MTDLTTMRLKCLLEQATPGPWESHYGVAGVPEGWDEYWVILQMGRHRLPLRSPHYPLEDEEYANFDLAAAAPELAQEVIRLREHFEGLITTMENKAGVSNGRDTLQELIVAENLMSAANQIRQILLGDHDE